jgi:hypothetical protein
LVEDDLNDKLYATPAGFTPSIAPYDPIGRKLELEALAVEIDPKSKLEVETNKKLVDIRDAIRKKDPSFKTRATGIKFLINAIN